MGQAYLIQKYLNQMKTDNIHYTTDTDLSLSVCLVCFDPELSKPCVVTILGKNKCERTVFGHLSTNRSLAKSNYK